MSRDSSAGNSLDAGGAMMGMDNLCERNLRAAHGKRTIQFVVLAGCIVLVNVVASWAQSSSFRIGVLTPGLAFSSILAGARGGLERYGYKEESNVSFLVEDTKGELFNLDGRIKKILEAKPEVILTVGSAHTLAAKQATSTLPIVFAGIADPVQAGLVAGYQSSKNNLTGVTSYSGPLSAKRLEILKEIAPSTKRALVLIAIPGIPSREALRPVEETVKRLGIQMIYREVTSRADIEKILASTPKGSVDAIFHFPSALVGANMDALIAKAKSDKIPLVVANESMAVQGALLAYGSDFRRVGAQAARLVAKVFKGEKPGDIPVELPEKFLLVLNATTAKQIGLKIPRKFLEKVDRVVE